MGCPVSALGQGEAGRGESLGEVVRLVLPHQAGQGFTPRDRLDLQLWAQARHRRVEFHAYDDGQFALLYGSAEPWASWAVARQNGLVLVWDSVTLFDIGQFGSMERALAALPAAMAPVAANVIPFPLSRLRL